MNKLKSKLKKLILRLSKLRYLNRRIVFGVDLFLSTLATVGVLLALDSYLRYFRSMDYWMYVCAFLASAISIFAFKSYTNVIRHSTLREIWRLLFMVVLKDVLLSCCILIGGFIPYFRIAFIGVDFLFTFFLLLCFRIFLQNAYSVIQMSSFTKKKKILIYGIGEDSIALAQGSSRIYMSDYMVTGFLVHGHKERKLRITNHSVYAITTLDELKKLVATHDVDGILFPTIKLAQQEKNRIIPLCESINLRTLVVPDTEEIKNGVIHRSVRRVNIEDLLGREEIEINLKEIGNLLEGKTVLVTGAAGSIGSEICRQLAKFNIGKLVCFDMGETPMHNLRLELEEKYTALNFIPMVGDVRNQPTLDYVFREYRPQVVFHAAAYKHVPLMEENPCEAIRVNVFGSRNVADMAVKYDVERFVMVSTDKAVNPTNIMGCSKRLAEIYVQSLSVAIRKGEIKGKTKFITTRFGNVLGSNGSVIPRFKEQIKNGGPVTVTDPEIIRFFMTIPEACRLVLEAGTMGDGGEIFVFDMGEPVKIADLARHMIELSGFRPDKDIKILFTGLRPGEKLYEEVLSDKENTKATPHPKINVANVREYAYSDVAPRISKLIEYSYDVKVEEMVKEMKSIVPEFKSKNSDFEKYDK